MLTLLELTQQIKTVLEQKFDESYWVIAEISELNENRSGHCYLELVEPDELSEKIVAKIRATIWSYKYRMLKSYFETTTGYEFQPGLKVLLKARVIFHDIYGLSLNIVDIDPKYTLGDIAKRRLDILNKLVEDGVAEMNKQLEFPILPQRIAIISSETAAGYQDFIKHIEDNTYGYCFKTVLFKSIMQGEGAEVSVIEALEKIYQQEEYFDIVVIIRGGGSKADLSCFDSYWLAYNVAQFPLPVITGIGHERDESVVDLVAHLNLKTPTAVAHYLIECFAEQEALLDGLQERYFETIRQTLDNEKEKIMRISFVLRPLYDKVIQKEELKLGYLKEKAIRAVERNNEKQLNKLSKMQLSVKQAIQYKISGEELNLNQMLDSYLDKIKNTISQQHHKLLAFEKLTKSIDPTQLLKKGYTLTLQEGKILKSIEQINPDNPLTTVFHDGKLESRIDIRS